MGSVNTRQLAATDLWSLGETSRRFMVWQKARLGAAAALGNTVADRHFDGLPPVLPIPDYANSNWTGLVDETLRHYGFTLPDVVKMHNRTRAEVICLQELCWRLAKFGRRDNRPLSLTEIGRLLRRDHTTVMHSVRVHTKRMADTGLRVLSRIEDE